MAGRRRVEWPERQRKRRANERDIILNQPPKVARVCFSRMNNQSFPVQADDVSPPGQAFPAESAKTPPGLSDPERWVEWYGDYLFKYALMRLRDAAKAEDATALSDLRLVQTLFQAVEVSPRRRAALRRTRGIPSSRSLSAEAKRRIAQRFQGG